MTVDQFVAKYNGVHVDEDGYYGAQCWDIVARYAREVVGCPSFPTGSGGAEGLYRIFANPIPQYFDRLPASEARKGDVAVFPASWSPPWGHTALVLSRNGNTTSVLEQNGNNPNGKSYITNRYVSQMSGVLRPKKGSGMVSISEAEYEDFKRWKAAGIDAVGWKAALVNSRLWKLIGGDGKNIDPVIADFENWKKAGINMTQDIIALQEQIKNLGSRPTEQQIAELNQAIKEANEKAMKAQADLESYKEADAKAEVEAVGWLKALWRIITRKES